MNNFHKKNCRLIILTALGAERKILVGKAMKGEGATRIIQCGMGCRGVFDVGLGLSEGTIIGSIGLSGGLAPDVPPGTIILGESIHNHCRQPDCLQPHYQLDSHLVDLMESILNRQGICYRRGSLFCVPEPLLFHTAKANAYKRTGALAVDMESAGAAEAAMRQGVPFFCLRVVCDPAERTLAGELFNGVDEEGNSKPFRLLGALCRRPQLITDLWRMARDYSRAATGMGRAWEAIEKPLLDFASPHISQRSSRNA